MTLEKLVTAAHALKYLSTYNLGDDRITWGKWEKKFAYLPTRLPDGIIWGKSYYSRTRIAMQWPGKYENIAPPNFVQLGTIFDVMKDN